MSAMKILWAERGKSSTTDKARQHPEADHHYIYFFIVFNRCCFHFASCCMFYAFFFIDILNLFNSIFQKRFEIINNPCSVFFNLS